MKKKLLSLAMLVTATASGIAFTNNVKAATKWDTTKSVTKEQNGVKYSAYLSEDGKESWIYQVKLSKKIKTLSLPKEINQAKLTRVDMEKNYTEKDMIHMKISLGIRLNQGMDVTEQHRTMIRTNAPLRRS